MTTHEAMALAPGTLVRWIPPAGHVPGNYIGVASPELDKLLRIVWDDLAEPDSIISQQDRRSLASFQIVVSMPDPDNHPL